MESELGQGSQVGGDDSPEQERELARFKQAVTSSGHAIYMTDTDGTIEYVNPAFEEITGYSSAEAVGENPRILKSGVHDEAYYADLWETILAGEVWEEEVVNERKDGDRYIAHQTIAPVIEDGEVEQFVAIQADITHRKDRERKLRSFKQAVEHAGHSILITDTDGTIQYVNPAFEEITGYSKEEAVGATPTLLKSGEHDQGFYDDLWSTIDDGDVWEAEMVNERKNGDRFVINQTISPIFDENGDIERYVAVNDEITERKEQEEKLRRRKEQFQAMFQRHSAPMLLIDPETGAIRDANEAATEFYGYDTDELTAKTVQEINCLTSEEVARERERANREDRNHFIFEHELADGDRRTVEVHSSPIELDADELLFSVIHDITERVEYEDELERYKELVERVPVGIYRNTAGKDGEFIELNPAMVEMFDAESAEDLADHTVSDLYADPAERQAFSETLSEEGVVTEAEVKLQTLTGEVFWGSITAIAYEIESETYFDGVIQDITARKEYESRLEDQRDGLEVLNQMVRHDIRNDLQMVLAYVEMLEQYVDAEATEYVEKALASARNAVDLTETARDMAEVMLQTESDEEEVDLRRVLDRQLDEVADSYTEAAVTVEGTIPRVTVVADDMLNSVVRNLLKNAIQHNDKEDPEITVSVTEKDEVARLRVADNGPGVPDEHKDEIFGKAEKGLESEGTGIGLYLVNTLVEQYGGDVWVEDREVSEDTSGSRPQADERSELRSADNRPQAGDREVSADTSGSRPQAGDTDPEGAVFVVELPTS